MATRHDYNRILTAGIPAGCQAAGDTCPACATQAAQRTCSQCGISAWVIDCGHYAQPRPLAAGKADGSDLHAIFCLNCA